MRSACLAALLAALLMGCGEGETTVPGEPAGEIDARPPLEVAVAGDYGIESAGLATFVEMARSRPDLYLGVGDFSYAGPGSEREFCDAVHGAVGVDAAFEIVAGNHEEDSGEDGLVDGYAACLPDRAGAVGEYAKQYYFDVGDLARFIMISPDLTIDGVHYYYGAEDDGSDTPELAWLTDAIQGAREAGIRWIVVGMHKPCISVGEYYCDVYQDLFSRLIEERVDLVLSGHDHSYQRSKQIATAGGRCPEVTVDRFDRGCVADGGGSYERGAGTVFLISGAGGAELYDVNANDPEAGYFAAAMGANTPGSRHGFAELEIRPDRLGVRFVGSTPGEFEDSFEIAEAGG